MTTATSRTKLGSLTPSPISNLPFELLRLIFGYCIDFEDIPAGSYRACPPRIAVTHVCSRWRAVALNCSSLWTLINTDTLGKRWIKAFLERSKASLIDVTVALNSTYTYVWTLTKYRLDVDEIIALFTGCTRLRSLHIIGELSIVYKLLDTLHTATQIRSLSLHIDSGFANLSSLRVELPENLFGGQAPIQGCALPQAAISSHRGGFFAASPTSRLIRRYPSEFFLTPCIKCLYSIPSRWNAAS